MEKDDDLEVEDPDRQTLCQQRTRNINLKKQYIYRLNNIKK